MSDAKGQRGKELTLASVGEALLDLADVLPSRRLLREALVARFARAVPVDVVDQLGALVDSDLLVHMADVGVHRIGRDDELLRHVVRRESARDEHDDLRLAGGKGELLRQFLDALLLKRLGRRRRHELGDVVFLSNERDDRDEE